MPYKEGRKWRGVVTKDGQRYTKLQTTKKEAIQWEIKKHKDLERILLEGPDLLTFSSEYLLHAVRFAKETQKEKRYFIERILNHWGPERRVESITPGDVQSYLDGQSSLRSANGANKDRKNLLALFNYGIRFLEISNNPVRITVSMAHDRQPQYTPPTADVLKVLTVTTRKERIFLDAYLQTAARRTEIFRWTWMDDINFERKEYRLGTHKTADGSMSYEWFPMSNDLYDSLWWWWNNRTLRNNPYVFPNDYEGPGYGEPYTLRRRFLAGICKRANVKPFGFHALRRYVASVLSDTHKVSAKTIQRILRHRAVSTTERYIHNINRDLKGIMNLLSEKQNTHENTQTKKEGEANDG